MLKTRDEILIKFAALLDLPVAAPEPPHPSELKPVPPVGPPKPIEIEPAQGTPEYDAKNHTREFLLDLRNHEGYRGYLHNPRYQELIKRTMNELVMLHPEDYFAWRLSKRDALIVPWLHMAAEAFIVKDPIGALKAEIFEDNKLANLRPMLWQAVEKTELDRTYKETNFENPAESRTKMFAGIESLMAALRRRIAESDPKFYDKIKDLPLLYRVPADTRSRNLSKHLLERKELLEKIERRQKRENRKKRVPKATT